MQATGEAVRMCEIVYQMQVAPAHLERHLEQRTWTEFLAQGATPEDAAATVAR